MAKQLPRAPRRRRPGSDPAAAATTAPAAPPSPGAAGAAPDRRRALLLAGLAVALGAVAHLNALTNPFVYDDAVAIVQNPSLRDLANLHWVLTYSRRPLVNLSYALNYAVGGLGPLGYHVTSLLLHALNVALLFLVASRVWGDHRAERAPAGAGQPLEVGFLAAALFAVHPLMTESVGYASARPGVLCATFCLLGILLLRRGARTGRRRWLVLAGAACLGGVAAKETAATLPLLYLAYDRLLLPRAPAARRRRLAWVHVPLLGLVLLLGAARVYLHFRYEAASPRPLGTHLLTQATVFWRYLLLLVAPLSQSVVHSVTLVKHWLEPAPLVALAGLAGLGAVALRLRHRHPVATFGVVWFVALWAPSSLIPLHELMAEHRVYEASAGFFLVAAVLLAPVLAGGRAARGPAGRTLAVLGQVCLLGALTGATIARNHVWSSPVSLWQDAVRKAPAVWFPWYALADAYLARGDCEHAAPIFHRAVELQPRDARAYVGLGICLHRQHRAADALRVLRQAAALSPDDPPILTNLGSLELELGHHEDARRHLRRVIEVAPRDVRARQLLANLSWKVDRDQAQVLRLCREILAIAPGDAGAAACLRRVREGAAAP